MTGNEAQATGSARPSIETKGQVIHWARNYDRMFRLITFGREDGFRQRIAASAELIEGDHVLDIGCGTGSTTLAAARLVGATGRVEGIDPSTEMIERAREKAASFGYAVSFHHAAIEALPFPDNTFDAAVSSLVFHHLTADLQRVGLDEIRRVLRPGGRLTIVDFDGGGPLLHRIAGHFGGHSSHSFEGLAADALAAGFEAGSTVRFKPRFLARFSATTPLDA